MKRVFAGFLLLCSLAVMSPLAGQTASLATALSESANNSILTSGQNGSLVDREHNVWTIKNGVIYKNDTLAGYSANVIRLAYVNGVIWQENASNLWWNWNGSSWSGDWGIAQSPLGTAVSQVPAPVQAVIPTRVESSNRAVLEANQPGSLVDQHLDVWTIKNGVVYKNDALAGYSANVVRLAYVDRVIWQENANHLWWKWNGGSWEGEWGIAQSPLSAPSVVPAPQPVQEVQRTAGEVQKTIVPKQEVTPTPTPTPAPAPQPAPVPQPVVSAPAPVIVQTNSNNPFAGQTLYRSSWSNALNQANAWRSSRPGDAAAMDHLAAQPTAMWIGDWNPDIQNDVAKYVGNAAAANALPVLVAYNIPGRDCGHFSAGGASQASAYHEWIVKVANGIGDKKAVVVLEPDATALHCFDDVRAAMLTDAVNVLEAKSHTSVYIDAGHPDWVSVDVMAARLQKSGIGKAQGFALNVSNFYTTDSNMQYGNDLSARLNGKHYVIDTSRNNNGWQGEWCNPQGAGIGKVPTTNTGHSLYDAGLWIKPAGDSDGPCNGGPGAGAWWPEYALKLYNQGTH